MAEAPSGKAGKAPAGWMVFGAVTLLSLVWLLLLSRTPALIADTVRDLLFARDCSELGRCLTLGAKTTLDGVYQGGAWVQLIAAVELLGGGVRAVQGTIIALQSLSCGLWYLFLSRRFDGFVPVLGALLWLAALCFIGDYSTLWNHSGVALPVVLASAGLLVFAADRSLPALWVAAFWTGFGMGFHMECATLLPVELAAAALIGRRLWLAQISVPLAFLLGLLPTSLEAARANVLFLAGSRAMVLLLVGVGVLLLVPRFIRQRFWNARTSTRLAWISAGIILPPALGLSWLAVRGHLVALRYSYAALPVAAMFIALVLDRACHALERYHRAAGALLGGAAAALCLCWAGYRTTLEYSSSPVWTSADAKAMAGRLRESGYSFDAARWHLQGPQAWDLLTVLAAYVPPPEAPPLPLDKPDLLVVRPPPTSARGGVLLHPAGRPALYLRSIRPWLDIVHGRVCVLPGGATQTTEARCSPLAGGREKAADFEFRSRKYPRLYDTSQREPYVVRFVIPVRPVGSDKERFIRVLAGSSRCPWRIVAVSGIPYRGRLPSRQAVLGRGEGGSVSLARRFAADCAPDVQRFMRPSIAETDPDDKRLRAALEAY